MEGLDKVDRAILGLLHADGRMSNAAIGERVHLSHSSISQRIKRLEAAKTIAGYSVVLDLEGLGLGYTAILLVQLTEHGKGRLEEFEQVMRLRFPNVVECYRLDGTWDYFLMVVATDKRHHDQIRDSLRELDCVVRLRTFPGQKIFAGRLPFP